MLYYIYTVLQDLLVPVTILALLSGWFYGAWGKVGSRYLTVGACAGTAAAAVMAVIKNTTRVFKSTYSVYVMWLCFAIVVAAVLFLLCAVCAGKRVKAWRCGIPCALYVCLLLVYKLSGVFGYLFTFDTNGGSILSADYAVRLAGWLIAWVILFVYGKTLARCTAELGRTDLTKGLSLLMILVTAVRCAEPVLKPWVSGSRRYLPAFLPKYSKAAYPWAFPFTKWVYNNDLLLTLIVVGLGLILPILLFIRDTKIHDPYENCAQLRKLKANGRRNRRRCITVLLCVAVSVVFMTAVKAWDSREPALSEPESYTVTDTSILVPLTQVEDGHLHRFEYKTASGVAVRWIVIKKPNSSVYGVGLDACDVCGNAGYYERDDQVICKRCDVVMNKSTIGFKGGCNPIPLSYTVENGQMIFSLEDLNNAEKEFR